jgi:uncharacterized membrane protein
MLSHYADEKSHMRPIREIPSFAILHFRNFSKRIAYNYFIRGFSIASLELLIGFLLVAFGTIYGLANWGFETAATAGTVMMAALPIIVGFQMLLAFLNFDVQSVPRSPLHPRLKGSLPMKSLRHRDSVQT